MVSEGKIQLYHQFDKIASSISLLKSSFTYITFSYVFLSSTIKSVGIEEITVAYLGAFYKRANSPKESPLESSVTCFYTKLKIGCY